MIVVGFIYTIVEVNIKKLFMAIFKYIDRYQRLDQLIRLRCTGQPSELAERIGISESYLYACLNELKEIGLPVRYNSNIQSYYYEEDVRLKLEIGVEKLTLLEKTNTSGGIFIKGLISFINPYLMHYTKQPA